MKRTASAIWKGSLKEGKGMISTESGALTNTPYSFSTRFEAGKGTNPEELIAAAHAGCFTMALSAQLGTLNLVPESLSMTANVMLEKLGAGWTITKIHLELVGRVPGASQSAFESAAASAKANCPVSRLLNAEVTLTTKFETA